MTGRLANKSAIVFGAGSSGPGWGNGKAAAVAFAREGAKVACVDLHLEAARETAEIIAGEGGTALALAADVTDIASLEACAAEAYAAFVDAGWITRDFTSATLASSEKSSSDSVNFCACSLSYSLRRRSNCNS